MCATGNTLLKVKYIILSTYCCFIEIKYPYYMEKLAKKLTKWPLNRRLHEAIPGARALSGLCREIPRFDPKVSPHQDCPPSTVLISTSEMCFQETRLGAEEKTNVGAIGAEKAALPIGRHRPSPSLPEQSSMEGGWPQGSARQRRPRRRGKSGVRDLQIQTWHQLVFSDKRGTTQAS